MRSIVLVICVCAAGCSDRVLDSPTSPTSAIFAPALTQAQNATELPFHGSFTGTSFSCLRDGTCPPGTLIITGNASGEATDLGHFTVVNVSTSALPPSTPPTGTGTWDFTAANGDQLFATAHGREDQFIPPNISHVTTVATITGGTGRFAAATGTFTVRLTSTIDFAAATASVVGSFEGHINLNK